METSGFMVSIIKKKKRKAQLQTHFISADRRNWSVFKPGSENGAALITMRPAWPEISQLCWVLQHVWSGNEHCVVHSMATWQLTGDVKNVLGKSEVGPVIMSPSPAKEEH